MHFSPVAVRTTVRLAPATRANSSFPSEGHAAVEFSPDSVLERLRRTLFVLGARHECGTLGAMAHQFVDRGKRQIHFRLSRDVLARTLVRVRRHLVCPGHGHYADDDTRTRGGHGVSTESTRLVPVGQREAGRRLYGEDVPLGEDAELEHLVELFDRHVPVEDLSDERRINFVI